MSLRNAGRLQVVALVTGIFLLVNLLAVALLTVAPSASPAHGPILLMVFIAVILIGLLILAIVLRWLLRPYRQLVGEAERAPVAARSHKTHNEAEFVLETFQTVVAQLQAQQRELEILSAQASARADSAQRFSERIVASVPSGLVAFDDRGRATVVNGPARSLIEAEGEAVGQSVRSLLRNSPELAGMVEHCLQTGEVYRREEVEAVGAEGRLRRLGATVAPIDPLPERGGRGALCLITDITEVTQLREQVALKKNLESLGEMSAGLAHEFKNALATLHGYAQLMQSLDVDERGRTAASSLLHEVRGLSEMVTAFLNFARPQPLELEDVSLRELIDDCAGELSVFYQQHQVSLDVEGQFCEVRADQRMLRQALLNLLRNAAEAIGADRTERRVTITSSCEKDQAGKRWAVTVRDTGEGIPPADLQRIFIPFFTTKSKGHGIGLALAHRVVTEHGGTLTASNAPGGGAIFTISLPVAGVTPK